MAQVIINDVAALSVPCVRSTDMAANVEVATILLDEVEKRDALGLASNQIGRGDVAVCVVNVKEPIVLINPKIIEVKTADGINTADPEALPNNKQLTPNLFKTLFAEQCLSFPNRKSTITHRFISVVVQADNHDDLLSFGPDNPEINLFGDVDQDLLEAISVQHEIDHLNGITMFDRKYAQKPAVVDRTPGRNEIVTIEREDEKKKVKYKYALPLITTGEWALVDA